MKKIISVFVCMVMIAAMVVTVFAQGSASFSVSASQTNLSRGTTVTLSYSVSSSAEATSYGLRLNYDTNVFELVGGECSVAGTLVSSFNNGFAFMFQSATAYSGSVGTVTLRVKSDAAMGVYTVSSSASVKNGDAIISASGASVSLTVSCDHSYGNWTEVDGNNHQQTCSACGTANTQAHQWDDGTVTKEATCKEAGVMTYECTVCGADKTEEIPVSDQHTFGDLKPVDENNHADTCTVCNAQVVEPHNWDSGTVTKPATCKETGVLTKTCPDCGATKTEEIPVNDNHNFGAWSNQNETSHSHVCTLCGKTESADHTWNKGTVTKPATCKEDGVKTYTCTGCAATKTETLPKTENHTWSKWTKVDNDTHKRTCSVCQKEETGNHSYGSSWSKDASGHWHECSVCKDKKDFAAHEPGPAATQETAQTCKICKYVIKPALEHTHNYDTQWTTNEEGHWHTCDGCEEQGNYAPHLFDHGCDGECNVCGFTRETEHSFGTQWVADAENHWYACEHCGEKIDVEAHIVNAGDEEPACAVCNYREEAPIDPEATETEPEESEPSWKTQDYTTDVPVVETDNSILWILLVLGVLAAICGIFAFAKGRRF